MPDLCFGFEAHQPCRLNRSFSPDPAVGMDQLMSQYFDTANREILSRVVERSYLPAGTILLGMLDEGFKCTFSPSGILLEQLEAWEGDAFDIFGQIARHRGTELIAQPYYHSIASSFEEKGEFKDQLRKHRELLHEQFNRYPAFCMNTELAMDNETAAVIRRAGFLGAITEGADRVLQGRSPNHLYVCQELPLLLRNSRLSDDLTFRFADSSWDQYPMTAEKYATWLGASTDEIVTIMLNYETFGEHIGVEKGVLQFLKHLPEACRDRHLSFRLPREVLNQYTPKEELELTKTISWAHKEKDTSAWLGNDWQQTAYTALQNAEHYAGGTPMWRYLQQVDHFYYMSSRYGLSGESHTILALQEPKEAFETYMRILADIEEKSLPAMKDSTAARTLRTLPPEQAFQFSSPAGTVGHAAYDLSQFQHEIEVVPQDSLQYHQERGDFVRWILETLGDADLSEQVGKCAQRYDLVTVLDSRKKELRNCLV
jgi:alpha-amylase